MRRFKRIAATVAATGLAGFGMATGTAFAAAAADAPVTGCSIPASSGYACIAGPSRAINPISFTFAVRPAFLTAHPGTVTVLARMTCSVNGADVAFTVSRTLDNAHKSYTWKNLQGQAGSPVPNSCDVTMRATWSGTPAPTSLSATPDVTVTAVTAVGGAVYQAVGTTSGGADAKICADDTGNGNAGTRVQSWSCLSDLAQSWVYTNAGQFVRNGDCMTAGNGGEVVLGLCKLNAAGNPILSQQWTKYGAANVPSRVYSGGGSSNRCLTAPSVSNGVPLKVEACTSAANQLWAVPPKSPAP